MSTHLLKAVNHKEDVGVAHLGLFSFAVHGVFAGGRKHLLKGKQEERAEKPASTEKRPQIRLGEGEHAAQSREGWVHTYD